MPLDRPTTRRTVLRGSAWAAPVVVVATAAPSYAASPGVPVRPQVVLSVDDATFTTTTPHALRVQVGLANASMTATSALVRLSVTMARLTGDRAFPAEEPTQISAGWTFLGATPGGTFTFTRLGLPASPMPFSCLIGATGSAGSDGRVSASATSDDASFVGGNRLWDDGGLLG